MSKIFLTSLIALLGTSCLEEAVDSPTRTTNNKSTNSTNNMTTNSSNNTTNNGTNNTTNNGTNNTTNNGTNNTTNNGTSNTTNNGTNRVCTDVCDDVNASICRDGQCVGCTDHSDCARFAAAPHCVEGVCVECTPATEEQDCAASVCNPENLECTAFGVGTQTLCGICVSSTQCALGTRCIKVSETQRCLATKKLDECKIPFKEQTMVTVENDPIEVCGYDESELVCEDFPKFRVRCVSNESGTCGSLTCLTDRNDLYCTYACDAANDLCPSNMTCKGGLCYK